MFPKMLFSSKTSLTVFLLIFVLSGCQSTITSSIYSKKVEEGTPGEGVAYSIPRQDLILKIERKKQSKTSLEKDIKTAKEALELANTSLKKFEGELKRKTILRDKAATDGVGAETIAKLTLEVELLTLELALATKEKNKKKSLLEVSQKNLATFKEKLSPWKDIITLTATDPYPSSNSRFRAILNDNTLSSEIVEIKTTADGLLSGGTTTSVGQVDDIIISTISAINALKGGVTPGVFSKSVDHDQPHAITGLCKIEPIEEVLVHTFSVDNGHWLSDLNQALERTSFCYDVELYNAPAQSPDLNADAFNGLLYPSKRLFKFRIEDRQTSEFIAEPSVVAIDPTILSFISLDKAYVATNNYEFEFEKGMLARFKADKPNEVVAFLSIPVDVAKAIISIPTEILQLKIDYSSKEEAYLNAQKLVIEAQQNLVTAKE
jgi:hypothetical protein